MTSGNGSPIAAGTAPLTPDPVPAVSAAGTSSSIIPPAGPLNNGTDTTPPGAAVDNSKPPVGAIIGGVLGGLAALVRRYHSVRAILTNKVLLYIMFRVVHKAMNEEKKKTSPWDEANMLQNVKNEGVHVTTVANQRYVYRKSNVTLHRSRS